MIRYTYVRSKIFPIILIWLSLLVIFDYQFIKSYQIMKKYLLPAALVLAMATSFAFKTSDEHLKGYISDSDCAASKMNMGSVANRVQCVNKCIKGGAQAVLVVGDKVYKITNQKTVLKYAGDNVTVDGAITGDTIEVTKISKDKS
jgi:hypothetical protein